MGLPIALQNTSSITEIWGEKHIIRSILFDCNLVDNNSTNMRRKDKMFFFSKNTYLKYIPKGLPNETSLLVAFGPILLFAIHLYTPEDSLCQLSIKKATFENVVSLSTRED